MADIQDTKTPETAPVTPAASVESKNILQTWKLKAGLITTLVIALLVGMLALNFFWSHIIAGMGMKDWSKRAGAKPIECMIKDTNDDGYVSCSAMLKGEVVPLECGSSVFNIGCRVNYGAAAAPLLRPSGSANVR